MIKPLPKPESNHGPLFALPYEALKWEVIKTAIQLSVFDRLEEPLTADELACMLSTYPPNTAHMLNALVALGYLCKTNGKFKNTSVASAFLCTGSDSSMSDALLFMGNWIEPVLHGRMLGLVQDGPPPPKNIGDEKMWEEGARISLNISRAGRAQAIAELVSRLPEFSSFERILDLGAGPGLIGIAVTAAHPSAECYLFDQPAVCGVADEVIEEYGMESRVHTICGDYIKDPIGDDYDLIMANYTLNFCRDKLDEVMAKLHSALRPGGVVMITSDGLTEERTSPKTTVLSWLSNSLMGMDMSIEEGEIPDALLRAGFSTVATRSTDKIEIEAHGLVDLHIARKI